MLVGAIHLSISAPQYLSADSSEDTAKTAAEAQAFVSGSKQAPVPTYFIGSFGSGSTEAMLALSAADTNINYLGPSGLKTLHGLNVAYLDGTFDKTAYTNDPKSMDSSAGCRHYTQVSRSAASSSMFCQQGDCQAWSTFESAVW